MSTLNLAVSRLNDSALLALGMGIRKDLPGIETERLSAAFFGLATTFGFGDCHVFASVVSKKSGLPVVGVVSDTPPDEAPSNLVHAMLHDESTGLVSDIFGCFSPGAIFDLLTEHSGPAEMGFIQAVDLDTLPEGMVEGVEAVASGLPWLSRWFEQGRDPESWLTDVESYVSKFGLAMAKGEVNHSAGAR